MTAKGTGLVAPGELATDKDFTDRVTQVAHRIASIYEWRVSPDELEQEMWLHLLDSADSDLLTRPRREIINKMAWKARDWARRELCPLRHTTEGGRWSPIVEFDDDGWEYLADTLADDADPYADIDYWLTFAITWKPAIETMLETVSGSTTEAVARHLMAGHSKSSTARMLNKSPAAITYNVNKMRKMLNEIARHRMYLVLSQAGAC